MVGSSRHSQLARGFECFLFLTAVLLVATIFNIARLPSMLPQQQDHTITDDIRIKASNKLAFEESLGFFDDIPEDLWKRRKNITNKHIHNGIESPQNPERMKNAPAWYQRNWDPDFVCFHEENVGGEVDGHKWVCDPHRLNKEGCLVYSFGSNGDFKFELDLQNWAPLCEIHIFDPDDYSKRMKDSGLTDASYHTWGIKTSYKSPYNETNNEWTTRHSTTEENCKTLEESIRELGHEGRTIDVFKIDCEGCEWKTYQDFLRFDLRQILIETHHVVHATQDFFTDLHKAGYVMFHKEPNIQWSKGVCIEFSFLKLSKKFFEQTE